jgi:hypothetical protein
LRVSERGLAQRGRLSVWGFGPLDASLARLPAFGLPQCDCAAGVRGAGVGEAAAVAWRLPQEGVFAGSQTRSKGPNKLPYGLKT